jgi:hypothetical protein
MATAVERIGDTKVPMSLLEKGAYINYQRIDDNLHVVRSRYAQLFHHVFRCTDSYSVSTAPSRFLKRFRTATWMTPKTRISTVELATSSFVPT